jgi:hypothetical protein
MYVYQCIFDILNILQEMMLIIIAYFLVNVLCEVSANQTEGKNIAKNLR